MRHTHLVLSAALLAALAGSARFAAAGDLPDGYGTDALSGSVYTSEISAGGDSDDYVFRGFPGMVLTAQVKPAKGDQFQPQLQIIKPGGELVTDEDGLKLTQKG